MFEPYEDDPPRVDQHPHGHDHDIGLMVTSSENIQKVIHTYTHSFKRIWFNITFGSFKWTVAADKLGFQISLHAIGDRAISIALAAFSEATKENKRNINGGN
jgi:hypothetical protein